MPRKGFVLKLLYPFDNLLTKGAQNAYLLVGLQPSQTNGILLDCDFTVGLMTLHILFQQMDDWILHIFLSDRFLQ